MVAHVADGQLNRESIVSTINRYVVQYSNEIAKPVKVNLCMILFCIPMIFSALGPAESHS